MQAAEGRAPELAGGQEQAALLTAAQEQTNDEDGQHDEEKRPPEALEEVGHGDEAAGDGGQVAAHLGKGGGEHGDGHHHDDEEHDGRHDEHQRGVGEGADQLGAGLGGLVVVGMETLEAQLQRAGLFAGADGLDERDGQERAGVGKALGQAVAAGDILGHLLEQAAHLAATGLGGDHLHAADDGQAGGEDDGELGAEDGQLLVLDALFADGDRAGALLGDGVDPRDHGAGLAKLGDGLVFVVGLDDAGDLRAVGGEALVFECGHGDHLGSEWGGGGTRRKRLARRFTAAPLASPSGRGGRAQRGRRG